MLAFTAPAMLGLARMRSYARRSQRGAVIAIARLQRRPVDVGM
jgi:hypothetical protein